MISLPEFKTSLGQSAQTMTEEQIEQLRVAQDLIAEALFEIWLKKKNANLKMENEVVNHTEI